MRPDRTRIALLIAVVGTAAVAAGIGYVALSTVGGEGPSSPAGAVDEPVDPTVAAVHDAGVTGEDVSVGVVDVTGFDRDAIGADVAAARRFGDDAPPADDGGVHGTAAAATVARVAPEAEVYLATFDGDEGYAAALDWLVREEVDVIVAPVEKPGTLGNGESRLAEATTDAVDSGAVVVAPSGNLGTGHWIGEYDPAAGERHAFDDGPLNELRGGGARVDAWLTWEADADENYAIELHRLTDDGSEVVARSAPHGEGRVPTERLTARLDDGERYALAVRGPSAPTGTTVRVAVRTHDLDDERAGRSVVAPAAAQGAIAVGAVDPETGDLEPFSSRGPTPDDRLGVDVVAPGEQPAPGADATWVGTSAAAAYVGGVAVLVVDTAPDATPREVRWAIAGTADGEGVDVERGHGSVDPRAAIEEATEGGRPSTAQIAI